MHVIIDSEMTDSAILAELGRRLRRERLNANISRKKLAEKTSVSVRTIINAEEGKNCSLVTLIGIFRGLGLLSDFNAFLPETVISPVQLSAMNGKVRERASKSGSIKNNNGAWQWQQE